MQYSNTQLVSHRLTAIGMVHVHISITHCIDSGKRKPLNMAYASRLAATNCVCTYVCMCVCKCVYVCIYMYVCIYVCG